MYFTETLVVKLTRAQKRFLDEKVSKAAQHGMKISRGRVLREILNFVNAKPFHFEETSEPVDKQVMRSKILAFLLLDRPAYESFKYPVPGTLIEPTTYRYMREIMRELQLEFPGYITSNVTRGRGHASVWIISPDFRTEFFKKYDFQIYEKSRMRVLKGLTYTYFADSSKYLELSRAVRELLQELPPKDLL